MILNRCKSFISSRIFELFINFCIVLSITLLIGTRIFSFSKYTMYILENLDFFLAAGLNGLSCPVYSIPMIKIALFQKLSARQA